MPARSTVSRSTSRIWAAVSTRITLILLLSPQALSRLAPHEQHGHVILLYRTADPGGNVFHDRGDDLADGAVALAMQKLPKTLFAVLFAIGIFGFGDAVGEGG